MKELINYLADPIRSFPITCVLYFLMMKYYKIVGTKKFAWIAGTLFFITAGMFAMDPNFWLIITWPDNIPISILILTVGFLTWFTLYKCAENDKRIEAGECPIEALPENREKVWAWPNLVYTELFAIIAGAAFLIAWGILFDAPLEEPANPTWAPNPAKAPWYFLGLQEMLVYFDPWMAGVVLPGLILVGLIAIPYIDTNPKGNGYYTFTERKMAVSMFMFGWLVLWLYLIIVGTFLRGPNWTFYGPFEFWDFHKVVAEYNVNLSEFFWVFGLKQALPGNLIIRELPGIILTVLYMGIPVVLTFNKLNAIFQSIGESNNKLLNITMIAPACKLLAGIPAFIEKTGYIRYYIYVYLAVIMAMLPVKMVLRWLFSLKYIIALPEWELNL
ncbi:MAG: hypothetical protein ACJAT2_002975 [Bacteriovoracaceae bacterium]|jgi:hypothetical protein